MFNNTLNRSNPSLDKIVFCANCGSEMLNTGQRYYCPNTTVESGSNCATKPVDTQHLLRKVVTQIVSRMATEETILHIVECIKEMTAENADIQHQILERTQEATAQGKAQRASILHLVEYGFKPYHDVAEELNKLDQTATGLEVESTLAQEQLNIIDFISDEDAIRETAQDPSTYMGSDTPDEAQQLIDLLIRKVTVDAGSALILYETPMPSTEQPEGVQEDLVELGTHITA